MTDRAVALSLTEDGLLLLRACGRGRVLCVEAVEAMPLPADPDAVRTSRKGLAHRGFLGLPTILAYPSNKAFICFHSPSVRSERAARQTLRYEVEGEIPAPIEGMVLDFDSLVDAAGPVERVVVGAAFEGEVRAQLAVLAALGLVPTQVTLEAAALANAYGAVGLVNNHDRLLGVHFGPGSVDVVRLRAGVLEELRTVPTDGDVDVPGEGLPPLVRSSITEAAILGDVDRLCVSGRRASAGAALERLRRDLGVPGVDTGLGGLDVEGLSEEEVALLWEEGLPLIGAAGEALGLRPVTSLNLLDPAQQLHGWVGLLKRPLLAAATLLLLLAFLWVADGVAGTRRGKSKREAAMAELLTVWERLHPGTPLPQDPTRTLRSELSAQVGRRRARGPGGPAVLDTLRRLTLPLPATGGAAPYRHIHIAAGKVAIEGVAPDYVAVDALIGGLRGIGGFDPGVPAMIGRPGGVTFRLELGERRDE